MTLSDTHLVLLSAAAQREDRLLTRPERLFGKALEKLAARSVSAGVAEEILVKADRPHWSVNEAGAAVGLRITAAGLGAIGLAEESAALPVQDRELSDAEPPSGSTAAARDQVPAPVPPRSPQPRPGSKRALVIETLRHEGGASVEALMAATGWLPHTVRAALTGLRQRGYVLTKDRNRAGVTHYRLTVPMSEAGVAPDADRAE